MTATVDSVKWLRRVSQSRYFETFVETGTDTGDTTFALISDYYRLFTIESDHPRYLNAVMRFKNEPKVLPIHGDSDGVLDRLTKVIGPAVYWLDAHWDDSCPLERELRHIDSGGQINAVFIDDYHLFGQGAWPTLEEVESWLPRYKSNIVDDIVVMTWRD